MVINRAISDEICCSAQTASLKTTFKEKKHGGFKDVFVIDLRVGDITYIDVMLRLN
jgi:hypothetical protein